MKKILIIMGMLALMAGSVLSGTLASYTKAVDIVAGSVRGKEFVLLKDGGDSFRQNMKLAPSGIETWDFGVKNNDGSTVTETALYYQLLFEVMAMPGKSAIAPLVVTVKDEKGNEVGTIKGEGTLAVSGLFPLANIGQSDHYTVEVIWPDSGADDSYAGEKFGSTLKVSATASQKLFGLES